MSVFNVIYMSLLGSFITDQYLIRVCLDTCISLFLISENSTEFLYKKRTSLILIPIKIIFKNFYILSSKMLLISQNFKWYLK